MAKNRNISNSSQGVTKETSTNRNPWRGEGSNFQSCQIILSKLFGSNTNVQTMQNQKEAQGVRKQLQKLPEEARPWVPQIKTSTVVNMLRALRAGLAVHASSPSTWEARAGLPQIPSWAFLLNKLQVHLDCVLGPATNCLRPTEEVISDKVWK